MLDHARLPLRRPGNPTSRFCGFMRHDLPRRHRQDQIDRPARDLARSPATPARTARRSRSSAPPAPGSCPPQRVADPRRFRVEADEPEPVLVLDPVERRDPRLEPEHVARASAPSPAPAPHGPAAAARSRAPCRTARCASSRARRCPAVSTSSCRALCSPSIAISGEVCMSFSRAVDHLLVRQQDAALLPRQPLRPEHQLARAQHERIALAVEHVAQDHVQQLADEQRRRAARRRCASARDRPPRACRGASR